MSSDIKSEIFSSAFYLDAISSKASTISSIGYALTELMKSAGASSAFVILFDEKMRHIKTVHLKRRGHMNAETVAEAVKRAIYEVGAANFVLVHNHPENILSPSSADRITTDLLLRKYEGSSVTFLEHFIISGDEYITMIHKPSSDRYDQSRKDKP